jgi:hypothetical protein
MLRKYENIALSNKDIMEKMNGHTNIILYPNLHNYNHIDELLHPYGSCILLLEAQPKYGHWVCILKNGNDLEYFNSYGGYEDESLKKLPQDYAQKTNQIIPYLSILMLKSPYKLYYNEFQFQKHDKNTKTCGRHCIVRSLLKHLDIYQYKQQLDYMCNLYNTDYDGVVTILTN